jgi:LacI family transcriptional regulator
MNKKKRRRSADSREAGIATIRDVANRAGVSGATVSHVINSSRTVLPETREKVLAAVAELAYRPHSIARSLRSSKTGTIGVIISDITNPFFADLVRGIEHALAVRDPQMNYILSNTDEDSRKEARYLDVLLERRVDGLIVAPVGGNERRLAEIISRGIPMVFVDRKLRQVEADTVLVDNFDGARRIVDHVIHLGRRRIGILVPMLHVNTIEERVAGYRESLAENGLAFDQSLVFESPSTIEAAYAAGCRMLASKARPDAVFCLNNFMTLGMFRAVHAAGLRCPEDIAIVGFDDFPWADSFHPQLTTVAMPSFSMGEEAVRVLLERLTKQRTGPAIKVVLGTEVLFRESCGERISPSHEMSALSQDARPKDARTPSN